MQSSKTRIILFGNPKMGTPLIQSNSFVAIDLPQKFLVFEQEGEVIVAYNGPIYLKERLAIEGKYELLLKIRKALQSLSEAVTK